MCPHAAQRSSEFGEFPRYGHCLQPTSVTRPNTCFEDSDMNGFAEADRVPTRAIPAARMSRFSSAGLTIQSDVLAVEEPLEIRLAGDVDGRHVQCAGPVTTAPPDHAL